MKLFIDTNVYLSFFSLTSDDLVEFKKLGAAIDAGKLTLLITQQVKDEFSRNREVKIAEALKKLKEHDRKIQFPALCKDYEEYELLRETQGKFKAALDALQQKVRKDAISRDLQADTVIQDLFKKATSIDLTDELLARAERRIAVGNPPGKNGSLGDAINWELLLEHGGFWEDLHIVSDDKDFYSSLDSDVLHGFLRDEWSAIHDAETFTYRRISHFLGKHFPNIKIASEVELQEAIDDLVTSSNFTCTHRAIARLSTYDRFGASHAASIAEAYIDNSQVRWILGDSDVYEFLKLFILNSGERLKESVRNELNELVKEARSYHEDWDEEIPF